MYILNILVPFDLIVDIDMGLIKLCRFHYNNNKFFYNGILKGPDNGLKHLLMIREDPNPLWIAYIDRDSDKETMDNFYNQFIEKKYDSIVDLSPASSLLTLLTMASVDKDKIMRFSVLCKNDYEKTVILRRNIPAHRTIVSEPGDVDLSKFNCIYVKNYHDLDKYSGLTGKEIYIPNYRFNVEYKDNIPDPILPIDLVTKYGNDNEISIYSAYAINPKDIPVG